MINIDIETYSSVDLKTEGLYKYVESPDFTILLISYKRNDDPVVCVDLASGDEFPDDLLEDLFNDTELKTAFNAAFELTCLSKYLNTQLNRAAWECTMIRCSMLGYPSSLDAVGKAMGMADEVQKDRSGKALIRLFSVPNKKGERNLPTEYPSKWREYVLYNIKDVVAERAIYDRLKFLTIPAMERKLWIVDQKINAHGVMIDVELAQKALELNDLNCSNLMREAQELTGLDNPNSDKQLKEWLTAVTGDEIVSLTKENVVNMLTEYKSNPVVMRVLSIKQELAKTSVKKYDAMIATVGLLDRIRGLFQLYGAGKTGRWAGRGVQVQNLTHTKIKGVTDLKDMSLEDIFAQLDIVRDIIKHGSLDELQMLYGNVANTMSAMIRTAFIPRPGTVFGVSDLAAIEARIIAWYAGEKWRMEVFRTHGKIYEASASQMFKVPLENVDKALRSKGKIAELALGFQGGVGAMIRMGALNMGLEESELQPIVTAWRKANPAIVKFWYDVENAAMEAIASPGLKIKEGFLHFLVKHDTLFIQLPSGRYLSYVQPKLHLNSRGKYVIVYMGTDQITKQWGRQDTYGGKLVENVVQGMARDVLAHKLLQLDDEGLDICMHVHDEVVMELQCDEATSKIDLINTIMCQDIPWAPGLPLGAASFLSPYYIKD